MVSKLDVSVGEVVAALKEKEMLENSVIVFLSDNGAPTHGIHSNRGSNYPLRGVSLLHFKWRLRSQMNKYLVTLNFITFESKYELNSDSI